jgi:hypothetical protein
MDFVIARSEAIMAIDNQPLAIDSSALASNISIVAYDCSAGKGSIEYSDSLRVLTPFTDVTPYVAFPNTWLTAAAALVAMTLTLAQAKRVKIGLIDGIFNSKRQLPISYAGQTWDATDPALTAMQAAVNAWDVAAALSSGDAALASNINTMKLSVNLVVPASQQPAYGTGTGYIHYMYYISPSYGQAPWTILLTDSPVWLTGVAGGGVAQQPVYNGGKDTISYQQTSGPNVAWPPLNATVPVTLSMTSFRTLLSNIQARRAALQIARLTKTSAVNLMTTIGAVIAYDVTAGWPAS